MAPICKRVQLSTGKGKRILFEKHRVGIGDIVQVPDISSEYNQQREAYCNSSHLI